MQDKRKKTIFKKVLWSMGAVMVGAILIIEISSFFLIHRDGQRAQELFEDTIDTYGIFWENKLNATSRMMLSVGAGTLYSQLCNSDDKLTVETAKLQLRSQIANMNAHQGYELVTFVYVPERDFYFSVDEQNTSYQQWQGIKENVFAYITDNTITSADKWTIMYVRDIPYLMKIYHMENGYIGSLYAADHILEGLYDKEDNRVMEIVNQTGNTIVQKSEPGRKVNVAYERFLNHTNVGIRVSIGSSRLHSSNGMGLFVLMGAMLLSFFLIFLVLGQQTRNVFEPLERLRAAMDKYSSGNMDARLMVAHDNSQIDNLYCTFNYMVDQIEHLKIQVYETELERQRINSNYLRIQIQPHFYTNILNLFYGMAQMKDYASIQNMSLACGSYFRYLIGNKGTFVALQEEIKCLTSYVEIQRYRYQDRFEARIFVEPGMEEQVILPLLIQTFFENSLKHNIMRVPLLQVEVAVICAEAKKMQITVKDNGIGFKKDILLKIAKNESVESGGEHIGIQNVKERIRVFYGQEADMNIESEPGNTVVTVMLPLMIWRGESEHETASG